MSERDDFGAFLIGFIVGGIAGAVTALMIAPQSGEETRVFIKDKAIELKDKATVTANESYKQAETAANEAVRKAEELFNQAKKRATELQHPGQVVLEEKPKTEPEAPAA